MSSDWTDREHWLEIEDSEIEETDAWVICDSHGTMVRGPYGTEDVALLCLGDDERRLGWDVYPLVF